MTRRGVTIGLGATLLIATAIVLATGGGFAGRGASERSMIIQRGPISADSSVAGATSQVPILCYHYLRGATSPLRLLRVFGYVVLSLPVLDDSELWTVGERGFEHQMEYLKARGYHTVTLDDVNEWQMGLRDLPPKPIVITFDDADESAYTIAYPILERLGMRATVFVITGHVGTRWNQVNCLDWDRLREMQESGVFEIESHTHDMHYKVGSPNDAMPVFLAASERDYAIDGDASWEDAVRHDLTRSRDLIREHTGRAPRFLAWPFGFGDPDVDRVAADVGFLRTCALRARAAQYLDSAPDVADTEHFEMPRYTITARTSLRAFRAMIEGTFQPGV